MWGFRVCNHLLLRFRGWSKSWSILILCFGGSLVLTRGTAAGESLMQKSGPAELGTFECTSAETARPLHHRPYWLAPSGNFTVFQLQTLYLSVQQLLTFCSHQETLPTNTLPFFSRPREHTQMRAPGPPTRRRLT